MLVLKDNIVFIKYRIPMLLWAILFLFFFGLRTGFYDTVDPFDLATSQTIIFPFLMVILWWSLRDQVWLPKSLLVIAMCVGMSTSIFGYVVRSNGNLSVHVARFAGDPHGAKSRVFREGVNRLLSKFGAAQAFRYRREVDSRALANQIINSEQAVHMLIWGDPRGIRLNFAGMATEQAPVLPSELTSLTDLNLELITQVPIIGMSHEPANATQDWVALVSSSLFQIMNTSGKLRQILPQAETKLVEAAGMHARWHSAEPRGFAYWLLGNFYLKKALSELSGGDPNAVAGSIACAQSAYRSAAKYIYLHNNPELYTAIHNNHAIAAILNKNYQLAKVKTKHIRTSFAKALSTHRATGDYQAERQVLNVAWLNYYKFKTMLKLFASQEDTKLNKKKLKKTTE